MRCISSRRSPATAPRRSIPISPSRRIEADAARARRGADARGGDQALHQGDRQGHPQGDVEDGHLDLSVLLRRADLRRGGPEVRLRRQIFHRHQQPGRRRRARRDRARDGRAAQSSLLRCAGAARRARSGRRICLPHPRRGAYVAPAGGRRPPARRARQPAGEVPRLRQADQRADRATAHLARHVPHQAGRGDGPQAHPARGGRARQGDRQALLDRRHVVRLDQPRGAHHARHRHEPHRRQVQYRRRRRRIGPLQAAAERRLDALEDQAGGIGPVRRDHRIPGQCRHDADQDGARGQAR